MVSPIAARNLPGGSNAALLRQRRSRGCLRSAATAWSSFRARTSRRPRKTSARLPPWSSSRCFWGSPDCCCSATQAPPCATPGCGGPARNRSRSICPTHRGRARSRGIGLRSRRGGRTAVPGFAGAWGPLLAAAPLPRSSGCASIPARLGCNRCGRAQGEPSSGAAWPRFAAQLYVIIVVVMIAGSLLEIIAARDTKPACANHLRC